MFSEPRVFVVDPAAERVEGLVSIFHSLGIPVDAYASAEAFLDDFRNVRGQPRCLIVEVDLPGMSGLELQRRLRRRRVKIPVVFVADGATADQFVEAAKYGAVGFFEGDFDDSALLERVQAMLEDTYALP